MSSRFGAEGCAPSFVTERAAAAFAKRTASSSGPALDEGHRERAAVDVAGRGRVHGVHREAGHAGPHAVAGHVRAARAEGEDDRLRPLREKRVDRRHDVFVALDPPAGQELGLGLVDRQVGEPRERRVARSSRAGARLSITGLPSSAPMAITWSSVSGRISHWQITIAAPRDRLAGAVHVRGGQAVVGAGRHREVVLAFPADHDERGPRGDPRLPRDVPRVDPVPAEARRSPGRRRRRRPRSSRRRRRLPRGPPPPPGWRPCPRTPGRRRSRSPSPPPSGGGASS